MDTGFFDTLRGFKITSRKLRISDDDNVDRLNRYHTVLLLVIFSIIICAKQYIVGEPLQCWIPKEFTGAWEQYAENYCWVKNTYFVKTKEEVPGGAHSNGAGADQRREAEVHYYQWVPFILSLQAVCFYLPSAVWKLLNWKTGIPIVNLIEKAYDATAINNENMEANLQLLRTHFVDALMHFEPHKAGIFHVMKRVLSRIFLCGFTKTGNYLTSYYMVSKLLYLLNIVLQFWLMNAFLGTNYRFYGIELLMDIMKGRDWQENGHFPRVTFCDFSIRDHGQTRSYTLQCVLVINMFTEKIYIFLWFWFLALLALSLINLCVWLVWIALPQKQIKFIHQYLSNAEEFDYQELENFLSVLTLDGVFVLYLISKNAGDLVARDLTRSLFQTFRENERKARVAPYNPFLDLSATN